MNVKLQHIKDGVYDWFIKEVAPLNRKLYYVSPLVKLGLDGLEKNHNSIIALLLNSDGEIDIDTLHKEYVNLIMQSGGTVDIGPLQKITTQDLDKLVAYIKNVAPPQK